MAHAEAAEQVIVCPNLVPESVQVTHVPPGWTAYVPAPLRLVSAGLMFGPPSRMAMSKPDASVKRGDKTIVKWTGLAGAFPGGKWMACWYGADGDVILSRQVADSTTECTVTYSQDDQKRTHLDIRCRS